MQRCIVCASATLPHFSKKGFHIVRCPSCRLMAVSNVPTNLADFYSAGYFTGDVSLDGYVSYEQDKEVDKIQYPRYLQALRMHRGAATEPLQLYEVGCATGVFLESAAAHGWRVAGIDISDYAASRAREKGLNVASGTVADITPEHQGAYDAVVLFDVIEHLVDPVADLQRIANLLKPEGVMLIGTPDAGSLWARVWGRRWHAFVPPQHLFYFSQRNLTRLLESAGFTVVYAHNHGKHFRLPYIVRLLHTWTKLPIWKSLLAYIKGSPRLEAVAIPINVGDTMYIIAKKSLASATPAS